MFLPRAFVVGREPKSGAVRFEAGSFATASRGDTKVVFEGTVFRLGPGEERLSDRPAAEVAGLLLDRVLTRGEDAFASIEGELVACVAAPERVVAFKSFASPHQLYEADGIIANRLLPHALSGHDRPDEGFRARFVLTTPNLQHGTELSPLAGVRRVLPGHLLVADAAGVRTSQIVKRRYSYRFDASQSVGVMGERAREAIVRAVEDRLVHVRGDVCCELSGGLDSSFVACLVGARARNVKAYMFARPDQPSHRKSEGYARSVADRYGIDLSVLTPSDLPRVDLATQIVYADEPSDFFWYGHVFQRAAAERLPAHSLVFNGFGADQLFLRNPSILPRLVRRGKLRTAARTIRGLAHLMQRSPASLAVQTALSTMPRSAYARLARPFAGRAFNPLSVTDVNIEWDFREPVEWLRVPGSDAVAFQTLVDAERRAADDRLIGTEIICDDLAYLATPRIVDAPFFDPKGIGEASPYCDLALTDFVYDQVSAHLVHDFEARYKELLREAMRGIVPEDLRARSSDTFVFDSARNDFMTDNRETLALLLRDRDVIDESWISAAGAQRAFEELMFGRQTSTTRAVLSLLGYLVWWRDLRAAVAAARSVRSR